jgi:hypothetical protein
LVDLDLLLFGDEQLTARDVEVPHPRMSFRRFVLEPAVEIAPEFVHPSSGCTLQQLWRAIETRRDLILWWRPRPEWLQEVLSELQGQICEEPPEGMQALETRPLGIYNLGETGFYLVVVDDERTLREWAPLAKLLVFSRPESLGISSLVSGPVLCLDENSGGPAEELAAAISGLKLP